MNVELNEDLSQINQAFHQSKMSKEDYRAQRRELIEALRKPITKPLVIEKNPIETRRVVAVVVLSLALILILIASRTNT